MNKNGGFTLIEVLIALVILAISLAAIVKVTSQSVSHLTYVQNKTIAHWVALNALADMHAGGITDLQSARSYSGTEQMLSRIWRWELALNEAPDAPDILQVNITVYLSGNDKPIETLADYISRA